MSWILALAYFVFLIWIGIAASRKIKNFEGYIVAGRDLGFWIFTILVIASCMSGMSILGSSGLGYIAGWPTLWEQIFVPLSCALTILLFGSKLHRISMRNKYLTLQDYLVHRYESPRLVRGISGFAVFTVSLIYLVGQYTAVGITLQRVIGISYTWAVVVGAVIVTFYVFLGGLYAVSWTTLIQGIILILGVLFVTPVIIYKAGGLTHINETLKSIDPHMVNIFFPQVHPPYAPYGFMTPIYTISFALLLSLGLAAAPHVINNVLAARKNSYFKWSPLAAFGIYVVIFYLIKIAGFAARTMVADGIISLPTGVANPQDFCFIVAVEHSFGPFFWTFFGMIVLAAVMSTTDRLLLTIGSSFAWDIYRNLFKRDTSDAGVIKVSRIVVFVAAVLSVFLALNPPKLLAWLIWMGIGIMLSVFVTPILAGLFWKRATKTGAVWSMIIGLSGAIIFGYIDRFMVRLPFHFSFIPFIMSVLTMVVVSYCSRRTSETVLGETETGMWF
ncbi:sodium/solute symporter [bacterium]|nr:sodium/solute symporter [bacterium]